MSSKLRNTSPFSGLRPQLDVNYNHSCFQIVGLLLLKQYSFLPVSYFLLPIPPKEPTTQSLNLLANCSNEAAVVDGITSIAVAKVEIGDACNRGFWVIYRPNPGLCSVKERVDI